MFQSFDDGQEIKQNQQTTVCRNATMIISTESHNMSFLSKPQRAPASLCKKTKKTKRFRAGRQNSADSTELRFYSSYIQYCTVARFLSERVHLQYAIQETRIVFKKDENDCLWVALASFLSYSTVGLFTSTNSNQEMGSLEIKVLLFTYIDALCAFQGTALV
jgi:hypothetical protein